MSYKVIVSNCVRLNCIRPELPFFIREANELQKKGIESAIMVIDDTIMKSIKKRGTQSQYYQRQTERTNEWFVLVRASNPDDETDTFLDTQDPDLQGMYHNNYRHYSTLEDIQGKIIFEFKSCSAELEEVSKICVKYLNEAKNIGK